MRASKTVNGVTTTRVPTKRRGDAAALWEEERPGLKAKFARSANKQQGRDVTRDGMNIAAETDGSGTVTAKYYRGISLISQERSGTVSYYQFNGHGDVTGLTDTSGNVTASYQYDAFGVELNPNQSDPNPFRYCGEYFDPETNNIYLRNRYYSPSNGRFLTEDPAKDGGNWYVYVCDIIEIKIFLGFLCLLGKIYTISWKMSCI